MSSFESESPYSFNSSSYLLRSSAGNIPKHDVIRRQQDKDNIKRIILLAASVFHFHMIDIPELKNYLKENGILVKP